MLDIVSFIIPPMPRNALPRFSPSDSTDFSMPPAPPPALFMASIGDAGFIAPMPPPNKPFIAPPMLPIALKVLDISFAINATDMLPITAAIVISPPLIDGPAIALPLASVVPLIPSILPIAVLPKLSINLLTEVMA